mmetsp:Transcript_15530/g.58887  ORF Transcript_15530/g.58887 Transcript_15530/m.58887 type:complete len:250 (+) Transcript_15530:293-1042(+)
MTRATTMRSWRAEAELRSGSPCSRAGGTRSNAQWRSRTTSTRQSRLRQSPTRSTTDARGAVGTKAPQSTHLLRTALQAIPPRRRAQIPPLRLERGRRFRPTEQLGSTALQAMWCHFVGVAARERRIIAPEPSVSETTGSVDRSAAGACLAIDEHRAPSAGATVKPLCCSCHRPHFPSATWLTWRRRALPAEPKSWQSWKSAAQRTSAWQSLRCPLTLTRRFPAPSSPRRQQVTAPSVVAPPFAQQRAKP